MHKGNGMKFLDNQVLLILAGTHSSISSHTKKKPMHIRFSTIAASQLSSTDVLQTFSHDIEDLLIVFPPKKLSKSPNIILLYAYLTCIFHLLKNSF